MNENDISRAAAKRLATEMPSGFPEMVEARIAAPDSRPDKYIDPSLVVALAGVLVSAASLGWTIYTDLRSKTSEGPSKDTLRRELRLKLYSTETVSREQKDRILEVVVEEIIETER